MSTGPRRASVRALAKINLTLRVLGRRPDGFHEIRTVLQTISLADRLEIAYTPGRGRRVEIETELPGEPQDNLAVRAAEAVMERGRIRGAVQIRLEKRIPAGGGLGGGSSDAAAVLLTLPVLAGRNLGLDALHALAAELGSDVPFFLLGGTALGLGRGTEIHPLPDAPRLRGLLVMPDVAVSTAEAYRALGRELTPPGAGCDTRIVEALTWQLGLGFSAERWAESAVNDFEEYAFGRHPALRRIAGKLRRAGARPVMMSGSGSSVFGIFERGEDLERARHALRGLRSESFYLVSRGRYRRMWWQRLMGHLSDEKWPPRSRYAR